MSDSTSVHCVIPGCTRPFKPQGASIALNLKINNANLIKDDHAVTYIWRLNCGIPGMIMNWSCFMGQPAVKWACIGDPKEREPLLGLMSWTIIDIRLSLTFLYLIFPLP